MSSTISASSAIMLKPPLYLFRSWGYDGAVMHVDHPIKAYRKLAPAPIVLAFLVTPLSSLLIRAAGFPEPALQAAQFGDGLWLILSAVALVMCLFRPSEGRKVMRLPAVGGALLFSLLVAGLFVFLAPILGEMPQLGPWLSALKPLAYALFAVAWARTFGLPRLEVVRNVGAVLGFLVFADFVLKVLVPDTAGLSIGDRGALAVLLLISFCTGLRPPKHVDQPEGPAWGLDSHQGWIVLGLMATFSRPALFAAGWTWLFFGRGKAGWRLLVAFSLVLAMGAAMLEPLPIMQDMGRYADYWVWLECLRGFSDNPGLLLTGVPLDAIITEHIPPGIQTIMNMSGRYGADGAVYVWQVDPLWIRLLLNWGLVPIAVLGLGIMIIAAAAGTPLAAGFAACLLAQGASDGIIYSPETAIPVLLTAALAFRVAPGATATDQPVEQAS